MLKMICQYIQTLVCCSWEVSGYCCQCPKQQKTKQLLYWRTRRTNQRNKPHSVTAVLTAAAATVKKDLHPFGDSLCLEWLVQGDIVVNSVLWYLK